MQIERDVLQTLIHDWVVLIGAALSLITLDKLVMGATLIYTVLRIWREFKQIQRDSK